MRRPAAGGAAAPQTLSAERGSVPEIFGWLFEPFPCFAAWNSGFNSLPVVFELIQVPTYETKIPP